MEKVTLNGVEQISEQEIDTIRALIDAHSKDVHYLAFARQLYGFSPLNAWVKDNDVIMDKQQEIIDKLLEKKEVCSLYPSERLSLYPIEMDDSANGYHIDLSNNDKNFTDILKFIKKDDFETVITSLQDLLKKSKKLKNVYITNCAYHVI